MHKIVNKSITSMKDMDFSRSYVSPKLFQWRYRCSDSGDFN